MHPKIESLIRERQEFASILKFYSLVLEKQGLSRPDDLSPLIDFREDSIKDRLTRGIPLIDASGIIRLNLQNSIALFYDMLELIRGSSDPFRRLLKDLDADKGGIDIEGVIKVVLGGDQEGLKGVAERSGLSDDLLYFLVRLSLTPSLDLLSSRAKEKIDIGWWDEPFCPLCGQLPHMTQAEEEGRLLSCSFCWTRWIYRGRGCPFCAADDERMVGTLLRKGEDGYHLRICGNCNGYIKVIERGLLSEEMDNRIIDLISLPLDIIARQKGHKGPAPFPI